MVKLLHYGASVLLLAAFFLTPATAAPMAEKVTSGQRMAVLEFLSAVASGDPQAVAFTLHPDDLQALRLRILTLLRDEAKRGDSTIRARLFGPGMPLEEIERLTNIGFYATLSYKFYLTGREYTEVEGLAAIADKGDQVHIVVRGRQPREHGKVRVVNVVTVRPYGKDWKATLPSEIEAQIDDLIEGRHIAVAVRAPAVQPGSPRGGSGGATAAAVPAIVELLKNAQESLEAGRCDEYYGKQMSPNFRRVTGKKALESLVASCQNSMGTRQLLLSTLHIVRGLEPRYENESQRAVYDLSGQGLPFQTFSLEQVDKRWYVAE
ncbi:MAG: hypothetical protein ACJ8R9_23930 [Steroidobacteraceae bacterium]